MANEYRAPIINCSYLGSAWGYGYGWTYKEALQDALRTAQKRDPNAQINGNVVEANFGYSL
jgi:hypothetical protein